MRVRINDHLCQGHGMCLMACPEIFALNDEDGHGFVKRADVPPDLADKVVLAVQSCPEGAIETY